MNKMPLTPDWWAARARKNRTPPSLSLSPGWLGRKSRQTFRLPLKWSKPKKQPNLSIATKMAAKCNQTPKMKSPGTELRVYNFASCPTERPTGRRAVPEVVPQPFIPTPSPERDGGLDLANGIPRDCFWARRRSMEDPTPPLDWLGVSKPACFKALNQSGVFFWGV